MHIDLMDKIFPGVKYIFIKRDPRKMMASLKYVNEQDGGRGQYHPVFYSLYWKKSVQIMSDPALQNKVLHISFETLTTNTQDVISKISEYLGSQFNGEIKKIY